MELSKINLLNVILIILLLLIVVNVSAETTFFDQDDAFIMGSSATEGTTGGTTGGSGGGGSCRYKWNCTNWNGCLQSGKQTRDCVNIGTCSDTYKTPEIKQNCSYTAPEIDKKDKGPGKETPAKETEKENETGKINGKEIVNKNKVFIYIIIVLIIGFVIFYLKRLYKNSFRDEGQERINSSLNYITSLINRKVYTENGIYIGDVVEVIIGANRIDSIKIDIKNEKYELGKIKGCIINIKNIQCFGEIVIVDKEVIDILMEKLIKK